MSSKTSIFLPDANATDALAQRLAPLLGTGDILLLSGPVGAGKTAFCRALIQTLQRDAGQPAEDVPSPTYTLVQTYRTGDFETWHADLYRLSDPDEVAELGLEEAFHTALCLVEWPERLGGVAPGDAIQLDLAHGPRTGRTMTLRAPDPMQAHLAPALQELCQ